MLPALISDDDCHHHSPSSASSQSRIVSTKTAQLIATKLAGAVGPALRTFAATGVVTSELYGELARLYDLRRAETERYLDALTRYALRHHTRRAAARPRPAEDC